MVQCGTREFTYLEGWLDPLPPSRGKYGEFPRFYGESCFLSGAGQQREALSLDCVARLNTQIPNVNVSVNSSAHSKHMQMQ
jgi:hypothetical protein